MGSLLELDTLLARMRDYAARRGSGGIGEGLKEKLLVSDTPKGPIRLGLPVHVVGFYFPQLFPEGALD